MQREGRTQKLVAELGPSAGPSLAVPPSGLPDGGRRLAEPLPPGQAPLHIPSPYTMTPLSKRVTPCTGLGRRGGTVSSWGERPRGWDW